MVVRAAKAGNVALAGPPTAYNPPFGNFGAPHYENARIAAYNGLFTGLQGYGSKYDFWKNASRGEVVTMLCNLMGKID